MAVERGILSVHVPASTFSGQRPPRHRRSANHVTTDQATSYSLQKRTRGAQKTRWIHGALANDASEQGMSLVFVVSTTVDPFTDVCSQNTTMCRWSL